MTSVVAGLDAYAGPWIAKRANCTWHPELNTTLAVVSDEGELLAGVLYQSYNKANIMMHIAGLDDRLWATREFRFAMFDYPFRQLGCRRVTGTIPSTNLACRKFAEKLGFVLEATLKEAVVDGDLLVYRMFPEDCKWLNWKGSHGRVI